MRTRRAVLIRAGIDHARRDRARSALPSAVKFDMHPLTDRAYARTVLRFWPELKPAPLPPLPPVPGPNSPISETKETP